MGFGEEGSRVAPQHTPHPSVTAGGQGGEAGPPPGTAGPHRDGRQPVAEALAQGVLRGMGRTPREVPTESAKLSPVTAEGILALGFWHDAS